jgi:uncharacterized protein (TIGR04255 family)
MCPICLKFDNLPLIEAAVRCTFDPPIPLSFGLVNRLHTEIKGDFKEISEPRQFEVPPGLAHHEIAIGPSTLPGVVYEGNAVGLELSLQERVLVVRWLRKVGDDVPAYPRFPELRRWLWRVRDLLRNAAQKADTAVVNLAYTNFIEPTKAEAVLTEYFEPEFHVGILQGNQGLHKVELSWRVEEEVDLRFRLESGTVAVSDASKSTGFLLTTVAGTRVGERSDEACLDLVHDRLQVFFRGAISDKAKREWGLRMESTA